MYIFSVDSKMWPECDFYGRLVMILGIVLWRVGQTGTRVKTHVQYIQYRFLKPEIQKQYHFGDGHQNGISIFTKQG